MDVPRQSENSEFGLSTNGENSWKKNRAGDVSIFDAAWLRPPFSFC